MSFIPQFFKKNKKLQIRHCQLAVYCIGLSFLVGALLLIIPTADPFILLTHLAPSHQRTPLFMGLQLYSFFLKYPVPAIFCEITRGSLH